MQELELSAENYKLKVIRDQIVEILRNNDVAGVICLHTPGNAETAAHFETTYSCLKISPNGLVQLRPPKDEPARSNISASTANMVSLLAFTVANEANQLIQIDEEIEKQWQTSHTEMRYKSKGAAEN